MSPDSTSRTKDNNVSTEKKLDDLYTLIDGIEVAMMTTRRPDGYLVSRPMQVQQRESDSDMWFVTNIHSHKLDELESDPHVNLGFYKDRTREWVSVSGTARVSQDRAKIRQLYKADWKAWFGDNGGAENGGPDDPRMALVFVDAQSVTYLKSDKPQPIVLYEIVKGLVTGKAAKTGDLRELSEHELRGASA